MGRSVLPSVVLLLALTQFDQRFALTWNVPCAPVPDASALLGTAEGEAVVTITPVSPTQWHLEVRFVAPIPGQRQLDASTCEDAARAALLFLKLGATAQPDRTPVAARPPEPEPPPPPPPPPAPPPPPVPIDLRVDVGAAVNVGTLPSASPRITAAVGLARGPLTASIAVRAGVPVTFTGGPTRARFLVHPAMGAQLSGCFLTKVWLLRAGPCLAFAAEWWRVAGLDIDLPRSGSEAWLGAGSDLRVQFHPTGGLYACAQVGIRVSLRRPQIHFDGFGEAFTVSSISGEGALGLGWQW